MRQEISFITFSEADLIRLSAYERYYAPSAYINCAEKKQIGAKGGPCRFCGRGLPDVKFSKKAHAIPEMLGNKKVIANDECNECNEYFGGNLENCLGNFTAIDRSLLFIGGKNGIPTIKSKDKKSVLRSEDGKIRFETPLDSQRFEIDEEKKSFKLKFEPKGYIPRNIFKCFTKMALSICPEEQLESLKDTREWVCGRRPEIESKICNDMLYIHKTFIPGPVDVNGPIAMLFTRKIDTAPVVKHMFAITIKNTTYSMPLIFCRDDQHLYGKQINITPYPAGSITKLAERAEFGDPSEQWINLSKNEIHKPKGNVFYTFRYGSKHPVDSH